MAEVKEKMMSYCGLCGRVYPSGGDDAAKCCTCGVCGLPLDKKVDFFTTHKACQAKCEAEAEVQMFAKAEKLEEWGGYVFLEDDHYFSSVEELAEYIYNDLEPEAPWPKWAVCCLEEDFPKLDLGEVLEGLAENHGVEDFGASDIDVDPEVYKALEAAVDAFNANVKERGNHSFHPDYHKVVRMPARPMDAQS